MKISRFSLPVLLVSLFFTTQTWARNNTQGPCAAENYRQFDFWLGNWRVQRPDGQLAGYNVIEKAHNGCVLTESYRTETGFTGRSINIYDRVNQRWHQTWVDNAGTLLLLKGGLNNGVMELEGQGETADGQALVHRISWTPNSDGTVRQHWQSRLSDSKQWTTVFDGLYISQQ